VLQSTLEERKEERYRQTLYSTIGKMLVERVITSPQEVNKVLFQSTMTLLVRVHKISPICKR